MPILRVSILGASSRSAYNVDEKASSSHLIGLVSRRLDLTDDSQSQFAIYEVKGEEERCLLPEEKPGSLVSPSNPDPKLVFKRKIFTRDEDEGKEDKVAKNLIFHQAVHSVIEGEYPCPSVDDVIRLAALQTQANFGEHNPTKHIPGFFGSNLSQHVPKSIIASKQPKEWEMAIFKCHSELSKGKSEEEAKNDAKNEYLNIVKSWKCYGTQYFKNCRTVTAPAKLKMGNAKVTIGVNIDGITVLMGKEKDLTTLSFPYTDLLSWSTGSQSLQKEPSFSFEVGSSSNDPTKYVFETKFASSINDLVQNYVDVLIDMIKLDIVNETTSPRE